MASKWVLVVGPCWSSMWRPGLTACPDLAFSPSWLPCTLWSFRRLPSQGLSGWYLLPALKLYGVGGFLRFLINKMWEENNYKMGFH